jgi:hypothetical protein
MGRLLAYILFYTLSFSVATATTWSAAQPYKIVSAENDIIVEAIPYQPYHWSPLGETRVYKAGRLLYTIDKYFREPVFTTSNGEYFIVVFNSNSYGVSSIVHFGQNTIDKNRTAIEIFKNGKPFKKYSMSDVIDTSVLPNNGVLYQWSYFVDWPREVIKDVVSGCKICKDIWEEDVLISCDTNEIDIVNCEECRTECDSAALYEQLYRIEESSIGIKGDTLRILTSQRILIEVAFSPKSLQRIPFDVSKMNVPKITTRKVEIKEIEMPDKFALPQLANGDTMETELRKLFADLGRYNGNDQVAVTISNLLIDSLGRCENLELTVVDIANKDWDKHYYNYSAKKFYSILSNWIKLQRFDTSLLPPSFKKYSFYGFIDI